MSSQPLFATPDGGVVEVTGPMLPTVQAFYQANPEYSRIVEGLEVAADAARREFEDRPPADLSWSWCGLLAELDRHGAMTASISVTRDLLAPGIGHIGLFIVATRLHGSGHAQRLYGALEAWMRACGARWLRLGAVAHNERAVKFWQRCGFQRVRLRHSETMGARVNDLWVMVKPLGSVGLEGYFAAQSRDTREHWRAVVDRG